MSGRRRQSRYSWLNGAVPQEELGRGQGSAEGMKVNTILGTMGRGTEEQVLGVNKALVRLYLECCGRAGSTPPRRITLEKGQRRAPKLMLALRGLAERLGGSGLGFCLERR